MQVYNNVDFLRTPKVDTSVVFSCDDIYFQKYGLKNLQSCVNTLQKSHCHIINPSLETLSIIDDLDSSISISTEKLDTAINEYKLKSYYYCARFFIANDLFNKFNVNALWICDADIIFNSKPKIPTNKKIGISYNPDQSHLWKKTQASLMYFHQDKKEFVSKVIKEYLHRVNSTNFSKVDTITNKYSKGDIVGLDQVCMSVVLLDSYITDSSFINLHTIKGLKNKNSSDACVNILVGKGKMS